MDTPINCSLCLWRWCCGGPGIVQLKVKDQRPKKAAKPTVKAFPSKSIRGAGGGVTPVERCCPWCVWCPWRCEAKRLDEEEEDDAM